MKPRFIVLSLLLAAAIAGAVWQGNVSWNQAQARSRRNATASVKSVPAPPLAPAPKPDAPPATKYADVAMKDLFSKDRNPTVVIEPPKVEPPKPMPPLPVVYGVMGLPSGPAAFMAERAGGASKSVREGDTIGPFKILALDTQKVTFGWEDKKIEKNIDDLIDRSGRGNGAPTPGSAAIAGAPPPGQQLNPPPPAAAAVQGHPGEQRGNAEHPMKACVPGDTSPNGTVADGYRKVIISNIFGGTCTWVPAQ